MRNAIKKKGRLLFILAVPTLAGAYLALRVADVDFSGIRYRPRAEAPATAPKVAETLQGASPTKPSAVRPAKSPLRATAEATHEEVAPQAEGTCGRSSSAQALSRVTVSVDQTPAFVQPRVLQEALTRLPAGLSLGVVRVEGVWYLIRFDDRRWGSRVGYVHCSNLAEGVPPDAGP